MQMTALTQSLTRALAPRPSPSPLDLYRFGDSPGGFWLPLSPTALGQQVMFQNSAGTTPVTGVEQYIGRWKDMSRGGVSTGNDYIQPTSAKRPLLTKRMNRLLATATLSTQNVTTIAAGYTLKFGGTGTVTLSGTATAGPLSAGTHTFTATAGTLTVTVSGSVTEADIRLTAHAALNVPAYQWVTTGAAGGYDEVGFPLRVQGDVTGQWHMYSAANVDLSATDAVTWVAAVSRIGASTEMVSEHGTGSVNGAYYVASPYDATSEAGFIVRGAANSGYAHNTLSTPAVEVLSCRFKVSAGTTAESAIPRVNGSASGFSVLSAGPPGGTVFASTTNYLFSRTGTSIFFSGSIMSDIILTGRTLTATELDTTERRAALQAQIPAW